MARIAEELGARVAVKAQVHVGGRGKAGGIKLADNPDEARIAAEKILGMEIKGSVVGVVLVERAAQIDREIYLGITIDRAGRSLVLIASPAGGVDIEEVAATQPEKILKIPFRLSTGVLAFQARQVASFLGLGKSRELFSITSALYRLFREKDASLVEINPLVVTAEGTLLACDGKLNLDDSGLFRNKELEDLRDTGQEDDLETKAREKRVSYVRLKGNIGCVVNGAGLAMATMDLVMHYGGRPANFLDIGGGAKEEQVAEALRIITSDEDVNTIFFNIFGGIVRCDRVAAGILQALRELKIEFPIVIRLSGTNAEQAREMLRETDLISVETMSGAARKAVEVSKR